jgi:flagellar biogenesis protein FliO
MKHARVFLFTGLLKWLVLPAVGAVTEPVAVTLPPPSITYSLLRVAGALALVFALFLGGVWLFRNWQRLAVRRGQAPKLNVLEVRSLGPRHALYVIGYERQRFLLSSAPTGVTMLTALPGPEDAEGGDVELQPAAPVSFAELLLKAVGRK